MNKRKIIRAATVPLSLNMFCRGLLKELSADYEVVALSSPCKELDELSLREAVRTIGIPMKRHIAPWSDLCSLFKLVHAFHTERPQMVHSITPKAGLLCMMAARITGVPLRIHTFTGLIFPTTKGFKRLLLMLTDAITCACATHVIPEGEGVKRDLATVTRKPMEVLGYGNVRGIDLTRYDRTPEVMDQAHRIRRELALNTDSFTFIFVGRLVRDKGMAELAKAFTRLQALHPHTHLLLVGDEENELDPLDKESQALIKQTPHIHRAGWQDDVRPWMAAADALVFPSYREGFPNVVIEAGAMGLPSIVTNINGSNEIIQAGKNGMIVPVHHADALYQAMKYMVETPAFVKRCAQAARPMVASRYEQVFVRQCLKDFYQQVLQ